MGPSFLLLSGSLKDSFMELKLMVLLRHQAYGKARSDLEVAQERQHSSCPRLLTNWYPLFLYRRARLKGEDQTSNFLLRIFLG